jgi:hypothetical protein
MVWLIPVLPGGGFMAINRVILQPEYRSDDLQECVARAMR